MCGRYVQSKARRQYERYLRAHAGAPSAEERPSWNIPPTGASWVARAARDATVVDRMTWGFPGGSAGGVIGNARIETAAERPTFREAWRTAHCIIPVEGWYEWKNDEGRKQPFYFTLPGDEPLLLAGLWQGDRFLLITTETHGPLRDIHTRRPVALQPARQDAWLENGGAPWTPETLIESMRPEEAFEIRPVSDEVNSTRRDGAHLIERREPSLSQEKLAL